jgi:hypothetical protein
MRAITLTSRAFERAYQTDHAGPPLAEVLDRAEAEGQSGAEIDDLEAKWLSEVKLLTFDEGKTPV